jgi:hypothetical protein
MTGLPGCRQLQRQRVNERHRDGVAPMRYARRRSQSDYGVSMTGLGRR